MYLTRLRLNAHHRDVLRAAGDSQALHAWVLKLFPEVAAPDGAVGARKEFGVLHRMEAGRGEQLDLLVQSREKPDVSKLPEGFLRAEEGAASTAPLDGLVACVQPGAILRFRLRANPTRRIDTKSAPDGSKRNGKRVPLRDPALRAAWITRKLAEAGFTLKADEDGLPWLREREDGLQRGTRQAAKITHEGVVFDGVVSVVDPERARAALADGIGPAKAYGFGLLSLAPL